MKNKPNEFYHPALKGYKNPIEEVNVFGERWYCVCDMCLVPEALMKEIDDGMKEWVRNINKIISNGYK